MRDATPVPLPFDRRQKPRPTAHAIEQQSARVEALRKLLWAEMNRLARMLREAHD